MAKSKKMITLSRLGIFILQLVVIAALLWASDESLAESDDARNNTPPPCSTEECKRTHPYYNTIPIPSSYRKNPPDVGRWYRRGGETGGQVWVSGLTDSMNHSTKDAYFDIKSGPLGGGWKVVRKDVAKALQLAQDYPSAVCHDNMQAAAAGYVRLTCNYKDGGETKTTTFKNLTTVTFNDFFDEQFVTVAEYHNGQRNGSGGSGSPYDQYYDSQGNLATSQGTNANAQGSNGHVGYTRGSNSGGKAYARYITNHVAPNYDNINRSTAAVFSMGNEQGMTLEEILRKQKAEYAPGIKEDRGGKTKSGSPTPSSGANTPVKPAVSGANNL